MRRVDRIHLTMLQLANFTPFEADRALLSDRDGNHIWVVVVKATFLMKEGGGLALHRDQEPVTTAPIYRGAPGRSSLLREAEVVAEHPGTDVIVNASALAPGGRPVSRLATGVRIADLTARVTVVGDRVWKRRFGRLAPSEPEPFVALPLCYERAFGGTSFGANGEAIAMAPHNPVGRGYCVDGEEMIGRPVPNMEHPQQPVLHPGPEGAVVGYGAVSPGWEPRRALAGTFDETWRRERLPLWPIDYDPRFQMCASPGLMSSAPLSGAERLELFNLTPEGSLAIDLPGICPVVITRIQFDKIRAQAQLDRVIVEPDRRVLLLVWRYSLNCGTQGRSVAKSIVDLPCGTWLSQ